MRRSWNQRTGWVDTSSDFKENIFESSLAVDSLQVEEHIMKGVCNIVLMAQFSQYIKRSPTDKRKTSNRSHEKCDNCLNHSLKRLGKDVKKLQWLPCPLWLSWLGVITQSERLPVHSWSEHVPGLLVWSPGRCFSHWCISPSLSPFLPFLLSKIIQIKPFFLSYNDWSNWEPYFSTSQCVSLCDYW